MPLINLIAGCDVMKPRCVVSPVFLHSRHCVSVCGFLIWGSLPRDIYSPRQKSDIDQSLILVGETRLLHHTVENGAS